MLRTFIQNNIIFTAMILFFLMFIGVSIVKPNFIYNRDGSLKDFGLGFKRKTVLPMWLITIVLAILSYLLVLFYKVYPRIRY